MRAIFIAAGFLAVLVAAPLRVTPSTGAATLVDIGAGSLTNGDGLLLRGRTPHVVQNRLNLLTSLSLDRAGTSGKVVCELVDEGFDVPTTVASFHDRLHLPNARFTEHARSKIVITV